MTPITTHINQNRAPRPVSLFNIDDLTARPIWSIDILLFTFIIIINLLYLMDFCNCNIARLKENQVNLQKEAQNVFDKGISKFKSTVEEYGKKGISYLDQERFK